MRRSLSFLFLASCALLVACGGGGGGGSSPLPTSGGPVTSSSTTAKITIVRPASATPAPASIHKRPAFIPSNTQSIRIHVLTVNGVAPDPSLYPDAIMQLSAANPACTVVAATGGLSCSIVVRVPVASAVVLQISAYASTDGTGTAIAQMNAGPVNTTQPGAGFTASLGGVPANVVVDKAAVSAPVDGTTHTMTFNISATDSSNNPIVMGSYATPLTLSITGDTNGALSLSTTSVSAPGPTNGQTPVTITYDTTKALTSATISVTNGTSTQTLQVNPLVFTPSNLNALLIGGTPQTVTVSEIHYGGAFTLTGNGTNATFTCAPASCTPSAAGGSVVFTITPAANGSGTFAIADTSGTAARVPFTVTGPTSGTITVGSYTIYEYAVPSGATSKPWGITVGPDNKSIWFTENAAGNVGRLETAACTTTCTTIGEEPVPSAPTPLPRNLASGNDGNVYVTSAVESTIYQVASSGSTCVSGATMSCSMTPISISTPMPAPDAITRGSNGMVYGTMTTPSSNNVFELSFGYGPPTAAGYMFFTPTATWQFGSIAAGPPLNAAMTNVPAIWLTDNGTNMVAAPGASCTDCAIQLFEYGGFNTGSGTTFGGISAGPNGNMWVIEQAANSIAYFNPTTCVSTTCSVTHVPIPSAGAHAQSITQGPDGNMWFTEMGTSKIGIVNVASCSTSCKILELTLPNGTQPVGITTGPDGNVWFTASGTGQIGKVVP